jgi:hypothetical protein
LPEVSEAEKLKQARNSPENKKRLAEFKKLEAKDGAGREAVVKSFDLKVLALQTTKIYEKIDPVLGLVRYGILNDAEANALHLEEFTHSLLPFQNQVVQEQAVYNRLVDDKKCSLDDSQVKTSVELLRVAKEKLSRAIVEANRQTMYRVAFGMLRKADPSYTEQDWANLAFNVKAFITNLLAQEMDSFLLNPPFSGLTSALKVSIPG